MRKAAATEPAGRSARGNIRKALMVLAVIVTLLIWLPSAHAAIVFFDNFEDGNCNGWFVGSPAGSGSTGVEFHNNSNMAYVQHNGDYYHMISHDFGYAPGASVSFDMQAIINPNYGYNAASGVTVSFLNSLNVILGTVTLSNLAYPSSAGPHTLVIDGNQHHYSAMMSDFATQAGLSANDPISTITLGFWAQGGYQSSAVDYFDNVTVNSPVPVPATLWLMGSGLSGLFFFRSRRSRK